MYPLDQYGLVRRQAALADDFSDHELRAAVRSGDLIRLTPGVFVPRSDSFDGARGADRLYRLRSIAVATSEPSGGYPLSHASAAAIHDLPLLRPDRKRVHLTSGHGSGGNITADRHLHSSLLGAADVTVVDGVSVTTLARTAVDVATSGRFAQALTAFDSALRADVDRELLAAALTGRRYGVRAARRGLQYAHKDAESVGESWSRAQMIDAGLPGPVLQREFRCPSGKYRCDFCWGDRLIGEFDGAVKYGRLLRPGESVSDAVLREKRREDELRALGFMVVRWTWDDLAKGALPGLLRPWLVRLDLMAA
ncbi:MAG: hypothetical protein QM728_00250 [Gordonia sp. (in: high G+C Gram-positive bacteria)]|uniref:hypothetical protein n=1 Tax=Gordonia sp. (in: high G+C Gram-positive bacteria) TaxID=84139 RepID=UPI0039E342BC